MGTRLFVGNLAYETSDADLTELFSRAGTCVSAAVLMDRATGRSRGFGFVEMSSAAEAGRAIAELNGAELQGRAINVSEARERSENRPPRGPGQMRSFGPDASAPKFRKEGGSRRGLRARKRSL